MLNHGHQRHAEYAHIDALDDLHQAQRRLRLLALAGEPGAFEAYRWNRQAERCVIEANLALNPEMPRAA